MRHHQGGFKLSKRNLFDRSLIAFVAMLTLSLGCSDDDSHNAVDAAVSSDANHQGDGQVADGASHDGQVAQDSGQNDGGQGQSPTLGGCNLFPADNMWNTAIDQLPVHARSNDYITSIGGDTHLHPDFGTVWDGAPNGIPYTVVPDDQAMVDVTFQWADESDPGPYPIPPDALIEGGPQGDGDRHVLVVRQGSCILYELYDAHLQPDNSWTAGSGAIWHLDQNEVRPDDWTSADAAGLAILPGLIRYEEVYVQGVINHAIRVTVSQLQKAYMHPATHSDGRCGSDPTCPPMGLRLRLKANFDLSSFDAHMQVILRAMKKYGIVVADTGSDMYISGAPDSRWDDDLLGSSFSQMHASDFEAVDTGEAIHQY
ncbi:MAG: hypothetical protein J7M25_03350 [Deltaproteobacteria bacterium]|nr:hypothetical protein [Deltaproteobacteria bacterium]